MYLGSNVQLEIVLVEGIRSAREDVRKNLFDCKQEHDMKLFN